MDGRASPRPPLTRGGLAMVIIGLLILVPSGLCTGFFGIASLVGMFGGASGEERGYAQGILTIALVAGGGPIIIGTLFLVFGLRRRR